MFKGLIALVVLGVVFIPIERLFALRREQKTLRKGWRTDVVHFVVNPLLTGIATVVVAAPFVVMGMVLVPSSVRAAVASQPDVLQGVEAFAIVVVGAYWGHRLTHKVPFLWRFHRVHHSSEALDWLASTHLHPLDQAFTRVLPAVPLLALGFTTQTLGASIVVLQLLAILEHANVRWTFGPLRWIVPNPQWHHWHHSRDARDTNFSGIPFVDVVFGTAHLPKHQWPVAYGIDEPIPDGYVKQMLSPFSKRRDHAGIARPPSMTSV